MSERIGPSAAPAPAPVPQSPSRSPERSRDAEPSRFAELLKGFGNEVDRGEQMVRRALGGARGGALGTGDLIALQAGIYRYSEAVDLAGKLVDRAGSAVKTTLQSGGGG